MTELLEAAIERLRDLPENVQDGAARALMFQLAESEQRDGERKSCGTDC